MDSQYDFVLKFLLVGDNDVGKEEILQQLEDDRTDDGRYRSLDVAYKSTSLLFYGKRVKLHIWNTSGQGRFSTVFHTYSRGAQGIILVYDITNKWSFNGLDRWLQEIDKYAPGLPKILIGNRKHLEFRRQITEKQAKCYADRHNMAFLEVSALCNFNIKESCAELSRFVLERNGMTQYWASNTMSSLQDLCYRSIVTKVNAYDIDALPLPSDMKSCLKSFSSTVQTNAEFQSRLEALRKQRARSKRSHPFAAISTFYRKLKLSSKSKSSSSGSRGNSSSSSSSSKITETSNCDRNKLSNNNRITTPQSAQESTSVEKRSKLKRFFSFKHEQQHSSNFSTQNQLSSHHRRHRRLVSLPDDDDDNTEATKRNADLVACNIS